MSYEASEPETTAPEENLHGDDDQSRSRQTATRQTRERLLDAALELFAERGFEATTTKLIAERAGVPNGLIYYYFGTKEKLLECLFTERTFLPDLKARITAARANKRVDPRSALIEICTEYYLALRRNEPFVRILSNEAGQRRIAQQMVSQVADQVLALLTAFLDEVITQGRLQPLDSEIVAHALFASILVKARFREFSEPHAFVERLVSALLRSASCRPGLPD